MLRNNLWIRFKEEAEKSILIARLLQDQDFYGYRQLKVPIHKYSRLYEDVQRQNNIGGISSQDSLVSEGTLLDLSSRGTSPHNEAMSPGGYERGGPGTDPDEVTVSLPWSHNRSLTNSQSREAKLFLQNMDRDLHRLTQQALERRPGSPNGRMDVRVSNGRVQPLEDGLGCDGADWGIPFKGLICMLLCLTVVLPGAFLIYKLYCLHHPEACPTTGDHPSTVIIPHAANITNFHDSEH